MARLSPIWAHIMRNYFNAIVIYKSHPDEEVEIIFKVGEVDTLDDIHVD